MKHKKGALGMNRNSRLRKKNILLIVLTLFITRLTSALPLSNGDEETLGIPTLTQSSLGCTVPETITLIKGDLNYGSNTPITLNRSGVYRLTGPLSATAGVTALTISANNVSLDLDGNIISGGSTGVAITGNSVSIKNGTVHNASTAGISITGNKCQLDGVDVVSSNTGFLLQSASENSLTNCRALHSTSAGFSLVSSYTNMITNCQALNTAGGTHAAFGFSSHEGYGNAFTHCIAQNTQTAATNTNYLSAGFLLTADVASSVKESQAIGTVSLSSTATAYGIFFNGTQNGVCSGNTAQNNTTVSGLGVGISADSSANYVAGNTAYKNDLNFAQVASSYITSQANDRGVYNINTDMTTADAIEVVNTNIATINNNAQTIESTMDVVESKIASIEPLVVNDTWTLESAVDVLSSKLDPLVPTVTTMQSAIDQMFICPCTPIFTSGTINTNKNFIYGPATLNQSGSYCLGGNCSGGISITDSYITLDLNNYTLSGGTNGLTITNDADNATVRNGTIKNATQNGVSLAANKCTLENLDVIGSPTGYYLANATYNKLTECRATDCTQNGFLLSQSQQNRLTNCAVNSVGGSTAASAAVSGFLARNGQSNTFDSCSVTNAFTNYASSSAFAQGFRFDREDYDVMNNCVVNGVTTTRTQTLMPGLYGIRAPLTLTQQINYDSGGDVHGVAWLEFGGKRYLAAALVAGLYYIQVYEYTGSALILRGQKTWGNLVIDVRWSILNSTPYLAIASYPNGIAPGYEAAVFSFDPTQDVNNSLTVIAGAEIGTLVNKVDWLLSCTGATDLLYLASADSSATNIRIFKFQGTSTFPQVATYDPGVIGYSCSWLTIGTDYYLAIGINSTTNEIRILKFTGTSLSLVTGAVYDVGAASVDAIRWLTTNTGKQYLAAGDSNGVVRIFQFDRTSPTAGTITVKASYTGNPVWGISWLPGVDDLNCLAVGEYPNSRTYILRFDGSCLTPIFAYPCSGVEVDWLTTSSTLLAIASYDDSYRLTTLAFSPTRNLIKNSRVTNVHGGDQTRIDTAAFAIDANNLMINSIAYNNDKNYYYAPEAGDINRGLADTQSAAGL